MVRVEYVLVARELCGAELPKVAVQSCDLTLFAATEAQDLILLARCSGTI